MALISSGNRSGQAQPKRINPRTVRVSAANANGRGGIQGIKNNAMGIKNNAKSTVLRSRVIAVLRVISAIE
jgi:hypothetical protein